MGCAVAEQEVLHENADNQRAAVINEQALIDLFESEKGNFSNKGISLIDVIYHAMNDEREDMNEMLVEIVVAQTNDVKKHMALKDLLKKRLGNVALEMNKQAA